MQALLATALRAVGGRSALPCGRHDRRCKCEPTSRASSLVRRGGYAGYRIQLTGTSCTQITVHRHDRGRPAATRF